MCIRDRVADNPVQLDRLSRLDALQAEWNDFGKEMIQLRRSGGDYRSDIEAGRGKRLTDQIRKEYEDFVALEQQLRAKRNEQVSTTTWVSMSLYLLLVVVVSGLLAWVGRRDLLNLSRSYQDNIDAQQRATERLEQQSWIRSGQSQLAERVLGQQTLPTLGHNILQFFSNYLGSVVAALYVLSLIHI